MSDPLASLRPGYEATDEQLAAGRAAAEKIKQQLAESKARQEQGVNLRTGEPVTREEGDQVVTETPYVNLPAPEATRRSYDALKALGPGTVTAGGIEQKRSEMLAAEIGEKGGIEVRPRPNLQAAQGFQAVRDFYNKPVLGSKTAAQVIAEQRRARGPREPLHYEVNLYDSISGKPSGPGPVHYLVNLEDRLSGGPYHYHVEVGKQTPERTLGLVERSKDLKDDPAAGFANYFTNIGKGLVQAGQEYILRKPSKNDLDPEVEGETFSALAGGAKRAVEGKPAGLNLVLTTKEIGDVGLFIAEKPLYAAGSIAGSIAFTVGTFGAGPIAKIGRSTLLISRGAKAAEEAAKVGTAAAKVTGSKASAVTAAVVSDTGQVFKLTGKGELTPLVRIKKTAAGLRSKFTTSAKQDLFVIEQGTEDIGLVSRKTERAAVATTSLSKTDKLELVKKNPAIETITDIHQKEERVLQKVKPPFIAGRKAPDIGATLVRTSEGIRPAKAQPTGISVVTFKSRDLLKAKGAQAAASAAEKTASTRKGRPFEVIGSAKKEPLTKTSKAPLETVSIYEHDRALQEAVGKTLLEQVTGKQGKAATVGGLIAAGEKVSLGFRGETGAGRKASTLLDQIETVELVSTETPPGHALKSKDSALTGRKSLSLIGTRVGGRSAVKQVSLIAGKQGVKQVLNQKTKADPVERTLLSTRASSLFRSRQVSRAASSRSPFNLINRSKPVATAVKFPGGIAKKGGKKSKGKRGITDVFELGTENVFARKYSIAPEKPRKGKKGRRRR